MDASERGRPGPSAAPLRQSERHVEMRRLTVGDTEIVVARSAGYCYGVERALQVAEDAIRDADTPIATLGPLIHNPAVVASLETRGIVAISSVEQAREGTVIVRTHGVPPTVIAAARDQGLHVVDATCPFVTVAQRQATSLREEGYVALILGERDHPEVIGLSACAGDAAIVVEDAAELDPATVSGRRVGIVVQTTQTRENLARLLAAVEPLASETLVYNTICDATEKRQNAACELAAEVEAVVVVGGRNSANTTRLAGLCREVQPRTYHIEDATEVRAEWFRGLRHIGVTAGASTPDEEIDATVAAIAATVASI